MTRTSFTQARMVEAGASYIVYKSGLNIKSRNCDTGAVECVNTDASTVIQSAMDALFEDRGGMLCIKEGLYTITSKLNMYADKTSWRPLWVRGSGILSTRLRLDDSADCDIFEFDVSAANDDGFKLISDMRLDGNKANNAAGSGIVTANTGGGSLYDFAVDRVYASDFSDDCIEIVDGWGVRLTDILVEGGDASGLYMNGNQMYANKIFSAYNGDDAIELRGTDCVFGMLYAYNNAKHGINVSNLDHSVLTGIHVRDWGSLAVDTYHGLYIGDASTYNSFAGVNVYGDGTGNCYRGLSVYGHNNVLTGCLSQGCSDNNLHMIGDENQVDGCFQDSIGDAGDRNLINGMGTNAGIPGAAGDWTAVVRKGAIVRDETNNKTYIYAGGGWREISAT